MRPYTEETETQEKMEKTTECCCFEMNVKTAALIIIVLDFVGMMVLPIFTVPLVISGAFAINSIIRNKFEWARKCYLYIKLICCIIAIIIGIVLVCGVNLGEAAIEKFNEYGGGIVLICVGFIGLYLCWVFSEIIEVLNTDTPTDLEKKSFIR
eukprot:TRINITY_DN2426_c0_g3_i1.p1 TRINITY_DN2426_c0_g3~~TRINITY_DN2426_c0_g3_i1.p1  ORF type:complete len:153 (-),score=25.09 TRINITY_DN2426_c0_g3_i1:64-522(-)